MISPVCQRWQEGKSTYRPKGETIRTQDYHVEEILGDKIPKAFVQNHHYSGSYPAARFRLGLYHKDTLAGVAIFSHPSNQRVLAIFPGEPAESTELGRFVLLDQVPANGESFFLARCMESLAKKGIIGIVSFSDPTARQNQKGETIFAGHVGTIYQATNAAYLGRSTPRRLKILPNGTVLSDRSISKIRQKERGFLYASKLLQDHGATPLNQEDPKVWLAHWLPKLTTTLPHPGNHRYGWILPKKQRKFLPPSLPYPKLTNLHFT